MSESVRASTSTTSLSQRAPNDVLVEWRGDLRFETDAPNGTRILLDAEGKSATGPIDALLGAFATCAASDVVVILNKRRTPAKSFQIEAVGARVDGTPRRLKHVLLIWRVAGDGIERMAVERAIDLSITKYCSVRESLNPAISIEWRLDLNGEQGEVRSV